MYVCPTFGDYHDGYTQISPVLHPKVGVVPRYGFNLATLSLAFSPDATLEPLGARAISIFQEIPKPDGQPQENHRSKRVIFQQVMELISGGYEKSEFNGLVSKSRGNFLPVDLP